MKPCIFNRFVTNKPGTPRGPVAGFAVSYCDTTPQQTMRPCRFIRGSAASRMVPPVLSK